MGVQDEQEQIEADLQMAKKISWDVELKPQGKETGSSLKSRKNTKEKWERGYSGWTPSRKRYWYIKKFLMALFEKEETIVSEISEFCISRISLPSETYHRQTVSVSEYN